MIRLLLIDDHRILLEGLRFICSQEQDIEVIATAKSGKEAIATLKIRTPDVIVLDISIPDSPGEEPDRLRGIELIDELRGLAPNAAIVILTMHKEEQFIRSAMKKRVEGYVLKDDYGEDLITAVRKAYVGESYQSKGVPQAVIRNMRQPDKEEETLLSLTRREKEVIGLIANGLTAGEIAGKLFIAESTVKTHRKNLLGKTGCKNSAGLTRFAIDHDLG